MIRNNSKIAIVCLALLALHCSAHHTFDTGITSLSAPASAYSNTLFSPQPSFTFAGNSSAAAGIVDSVTLAAYTDSACTVTASGTLAATVNPLPVVGTLDGAFAGVKYTCPSHSEQTIYLGGKSSNDSACSSAIPISQHFNTGYGYVVGGASGAAGAIGSNEKDTFVKFQVDSEGRYVVAGTSKNGTGGVELAIWRFYPDGTPDSTFGTGGVVLFGATGAAGGTADSVADFQIDNYGQYVIVGSSANGSGGIEMAVWRYTSAGVLDATFGSTKGYFVSGLAGAAGGNGTSLQDKGAVLYIDSSNNYVIAGSSMNTNNGVEATIWRLTTIGVLDTTFNGTLGYSTFGATGATSTTLAAEIDTPVGITIDSTGNFVLVGRSANSSGGVELAIWRFNSSGAVDDTFGLSNGAVVSGPTGAALAVGAAESDLVNSFRVDGTGRYVIVGSSANASGGIELAIWRYSSGGVPDGTFHSTGYMVSGAVGTAGATGADESDIAMDIQIDSSGNYVLTGASENGSHGKELALWRYTSAGMLDTTFNTTGYVLFGATGAAQAIGANENDLGYCLHIDSKGRFVISGSSLNTSPGQEGAMWRYLSTGVIEL